MLYAVEKLKRVSQTDFTFQDISFSRPVNVAASDACCFQPNTEGTFHEQRSVSETNETKNEKWNTHLSYHMPFCFAWARVYELREKKLAPGARGLHLCCGRILFL